MLTHFTPSWGKMGHPWGKMGHQCCKMGHNDKTCLESGGGKWVKF